MGGMNELLIKLHIPKDIATVCSDAIGIETQNEALKRSDIQFRYVCGRNNSDDTGNLEIHIKSEDLSALRASVNTYLRWTIMCCELVEPV